MMRRLLPLLLLLAACATTTPRREVQWTPCQIEDVAGPRCGTLTVPENWNAPSGRTIDLYLVVLPATGTAVERDPIFIFQGGPGQAATTLADFYGRTYAAAREKRDIVLVDQRGTGKSHPLNCDTSASFDRFPLDVMRPCRDRLAATTDLTRYTSADALRDVEAVRAALGYERLNLYGTSYGTRMALLYARAHPSRVRTMTLKGLVPPSVRVPVGFARDTERSIQLLLDDCEADETCRGAYPNLRADYAAMRARLASGPVGELTGGRVASLFRSLLQSTGSAADVPRLIHAAATGDWTPIETLARRLQAQAATALSSGMMLSVVCAEDAPFIDPKDVEADARDTFLGRYWFDQVSAACAEWPRGNADPATREAVTLDIPALLISGHLDPATPPAYGEEVKRSLPRSRHIVARYGSHSFSGMAGCVDTLMNRFIETADPTALDTACVETIRRPPFKTGRD